MDVIRVYSGSPNIKHLEDQQSIFSSQSWNKQRDQSYQKKANVMIVLIQSIIRNKNHQQHNSYYDKKLKLMKDDFLEQQLFY
ncbi:hypothetical protein pb186bvf_020507 [Paramecium bursaria]